MKKPICGTSLFAGLELSALPQQSLGTGSSVTAEADKCRENCDAARFGLHFSSSPCGRRYTSRFARYLNC